MGVDRGNERCVRGARLRVVICVSLSTAAIALPPSTPMLLRPRLRATGRARMVREQACQRALTRHSWGGGALERGHGAPLEHLAQLGDALGGVGTLDFTISILVVAAERVAGQAVRMTKEECQWALTGKQTLRGRRTPG